MKKPEISFRVRGGSGPISIYWHEGPYGDAIEAMLGDGVGWFSSIKEILGVEFDDVSFESDHQTLEFSEGYRVEVKVKNGKIKVKLDKDPGVHKPHSKHQSA